MSHRVAAEVRNWTRGEGVAEFAALTGWEPCQNGFPTHSFHLLLCAALCSERQQMTSSHPLLATIETNRKPVFNSEKTLG